MTRRRLEPWLIFAAVPAGVILALAVAAYEVGWRDLWLTADQQGRLLMERDRPGDAAIVFYTPAWRGVAEFRSGDFKAAAQTFAGIDTAESAYNQGNALVMLSKYDNAIARYDRALALRPGWPDAEANRKIADIRAKRMKTEGGAETEDDETADAVVYDKTKKGGQDTRTIGLPMSDESIRAMWLKRVQTRPADFMRTKFAYQLELAQGAGVESASGRKP